MAVGPHRPPTSPEDPPPLISIRHSSEPVLKWEENKKWQRKVDALRGKLAEKTREAESAHHHVTSLKETLARGDREKSLLQGKIKSLQRTVADFEQSGNLQVPGGSGSHGDRVGYHGDQGGSHTGSHTPTVEELQRVISAMRNVVEKLQRENEQLRREGKGGRERGRGEGRKDGSKEREGVAEREGEPGKREEEKQPVTMASPPKSALSKIASENDRLRKSLKREMEQNERLSISLKTSELQNSRLKEEVQCMLYIILPSLSSFSPSLLPPSLLFPKLYYCDNARTLENAKQHNVCVGLKAVTVAVLYRIHSTARVIYQLSYQGSSVGFNSSVQQSISA